MVDVAQLVEHQIVALRVMGSNPIIHPIFLEVQVKKLSFFLLLLGGIFASDREFPRAPLFDVQHFPMPRYDVRIRGRRLIREDNANEFKKFIADLQNYPIVVLPYDVFREAFLSTNKEIVDTLESFPIRTMCERSDCKNYHDYTIFRQYLRQIKSELFSAIKKTESSDAEGKERLNKLILANKWHSACAKVRKDAYKESEDKREAAEIEKDAALIKELEGSPVIKTQAVQESPRSIDESDCNEKKQTQTNVARLEKILALIDCQATTADKIKKVFAIRRDFVLNTNEEAHLLQHSINIHADELRKMDNCAKKLDYIQSTKTNFAAERDFLNQKLSEIEKKLETYHRTTESFDRNGAPYYLTLLKRCQQVQKCFPQSLYTVNHIPPQHEQLGATSKVSAN